MNRMMLAVLLLSPSLAMAQDLQYATGPDWTFTADGPGAPEWTFTPTTPLGVRILEMTPELRRFFGAPQDRGVLVSSVEPGGPAARAGLRVGDVLVAIGDNRVTDSLTLQTHLLFDRRVDGIDVRVVRDRRLVALRVRFEDPTVRPSMP